MGMLLILLSQGAMTVNSSRRQCASSLQQSIGYSLPNKFSSPEGDVVIDITQPRTSVDFRVSSGLEKIFSSKFFAYMMQRYHECLFKNIAPFLANIELPIHSYQVCKKSGSVEEAWLLEQLMFKKLQGACYYLGDFFREDFTRAFLKLKTPRAEDLIEEGEYSSSHDGVARNDGAHSR
jgi:hypothetical protein